MIVSPLNELMSTCPLLLLVALLFAPQEPGSWKRGSSSVPDTSWRKSSGDFGAMIVITDRYKEFLQECARPESPSIQPVPGALRRGQAVVAVIIFTGCRAEKDKCKSSVDFRVLKPDGSTYAEQRDLVLWDGSPPSGRQLLLSRANLGIRIEPTDPAGEYRVRALVFDHIAGVQLTLESRFSVAP